MINQKSFILGISSFLGSHLSLALDKNKYIGTYCNNYMTNSFKFDSIKDHLSDLDIKWNDFENAIILIGDTNPDNCLKNPKYSQLLNYESLIKHISFLIKKQIRIIFISSESIYDGKKGYYDEKDKVEPILLYGKQKYEIEKFIIKMTNNYCILRVSRVYGLSIHDGTLITSWLKDIKLNNRKNFICANDQFFSPILVDDLISIIIITIKKRTVGTFNISCNKRFSRYELLITLLSNIDKNVFEVIPCSIDDFDLLDKRPKDVSLISSKFSEEYNFKFQLPKESIMKLLKKYEEYL